MQNFAGVIRPAYCKSMLSCYVLICCSNDIGTRCASKLAIPHAKRCEMLQSTFGLTLSQLHKCSVAWQGD